MGIREEILVEALKWEGEKEIKGNMGFHNTKFQEMMEEVGHQEGQAWCSYFTELVWKEAYKRYKTEYVLSNQEVVDLLDQLFDPSAVATWRAFRRSSSFLTGECPIQGALVVWQKYIIKNKLLIPDWRGHIGVVMESGLDQGSIEEAAKEKANGRTFKIVTMEGNTNTAGGREGIEVGRLRREVNYEKKRD